MHSINWQYNMFFSHTRQEWGSITLILSTAIRLNKPLRANIIYAVEQMVLSSGGKAIIYILQHTAIEPFLANVI